jgi:hypothetical protein
MSGPGGIVNIVKASPTRLSDREMPAMQNHSPPAFADSHLSFRLFFLSAGAREAAHLPDERKHLHSIPGGGGRAGSEVCLRWA